MAIAQLRYGDSLDSIIDELVYTQSRLKADDATKSDLGTLFDSLVSRADTAKANQTAAWRKEVCAQALVDFCDDQLDDLVSKFADDLRRVVGRNTESPQYRLYFKTTPNSIIRLGLESELEKITSWPSTLASETDPALIPYAERFKNAILQGNVAVYDRTNAVNDTATQRAREIMKLIDDANAARISLHGTLESRAAQGNHPKAWADRFFRHAIRVSRKSEPTSIAPSDPPAASTAAAPVEKKPS